MFGKFRKWFSLVVLLLTFSACSLGIPMEELLAPPKLSDEQRDIYDALMEGKSGTLTLKYPKSGDYRSAFVHNEDTAIVFYEMGGIAVEKTLWMDFLSKSEDGKWQLVYALSIKGTDIERVSFVPLGDMPENNILVNYSMSQTEKAFVLIKYENREPIKLLEGSYSYMAVGEFLGRLEPEILVVKNDYSLETATASFYKWKENEFINTANCSLDPSAGEYVGMTQGKLNDNVEALFLNHRKYGNRDNYGTDIIYSRGNSELVNLALQDSQNPEKLLRRTGGLTELANPMDINQDGFVETSSSTAEFPGYGNVSVFEKLRPVIWRNFILGGLEETIYSYYSERNDFVFLFPKRWQNIVTVVVSGDGKTVSFYKAEPNISEVQIELLRIEILPINEKNQTGQKLYESCYETGLSYYLETPNPNNPLSLTEDELSLCFRILYKIDSNSQPLFIEIFFG